MRRSASTRGIIAELKTIIPHTLFFALFLIATSVGASAQQMLIPVTDSLPPLSAQQAEEEEFIKPSRPGIANPAEIQKPGVLQLEVGHDGNFRASEFQSEHTLPLVLRFAASSRFLLEFNLDAIKSQKEEGSERMTGIGDTRVGFQVVALKDTEKHPALAFAYYVKLPTASKEKNLGTGRVDHKLLFLLSKKFGQLDMDLNGGYLIVGREDESGWVSGVQAAISFSGEFKNGVGLIGELSQQSKDDVQPRGVFALGALTYKVNRRLILDTGMRFGLNSDAPRFGIFAGLTVGVADFYKKK